MKTSVLIVLASYNGVKYIGHQLDSLLAQSWPCSICIFDDGSTDGTVELIRANYLKYENIHLTSNRAQLGFVANFEQGIKKAVELGAEHIALSDQDDVWSKQKLEKMVSALSLEKNTQPTLVYSDLEMIDACGARTHPSYLKYRNYNKRDQYALATALGQNGVMGNTILMNRALAKLISPFPDKLHAHDYWISLIAQLHGKCLFISEPLVSYRIHNQNTSNSLQNLTATSSSKPATRYRLFNRDYRLPYKEDFRDQTIRFILNQREQPIKQNEETLLRGFLNYLNFDKPRWYLAYWMLRHQFIRKGLWQKTRFVYRTLTTKRY